MIYQSLTKKLPNLSSNGDGWDGQDEILASYGGKIAPRTTDGKLRYVGGYTRVLSVNRSLTFADLMVKFEECCGSSMNLKCKLPSEDLDVLVSIKSDEDIKNVIEEYNRVSPGTKIRALLFPMNSKKISPPSSPVSSFDFPSVLKPRKAVPATASCYYGPPPCATAAVGYPMTVGKHHCYKGRSHRQNLYHVPHWNYCHSH
ncbi:unnamed protein product [Fraxinus pennsylvanica]|uniref:PB1 domain-containing protein n=1 Tax=Fraxinus pennsylvanica TaxID=56036 RepID=A0AAD2DK06_9LAMI|nr:unnamed protein product [Fraxinus pennsylvanica]